MKMYKLYKHRHKTLLLLIHCHHPPPPSVSLWSTGRANKSAAPSRKGEEEWHSGNDDTEVRAESWGRTQRAMLAKGAVGPASGRWFLAQFTVQREEKPFPRPPPPPRKDTAWHIQDPPHCPHGPCASSLFFPLCHGSLPPPLLIVCPSQESMVVGLVTPILHS